MIRRLIALLALITMTGQSVLANPCATPQQTPGTTAVSGVVNTYYPVSVSVLAGATTFNIGASRGAATAIAPGDLLLIIQMQDATFAATNNDSYGDNIAGGYGSGYTAINQSGVYEFVRATNSVGSGGGSLQIVGTGAGGGLANNYNYRAPSNTATVFKKSFQVVRVPQYANATISGVVTSAPWDGTSGGVVALDVAGRLTFAGGTISVAGQGFRGGAGLQLQGQQSGVSATDYRTNVSKNAHASKGEGIGGTPRSVFDNGVVASLAVESLANGSFGRGAPGNAGGGGTDGSPITYNTYNSGGGGGGNGGQGGKGGHAWCPSGPPNCVQTGGHPGSVVAEVGVGRVVMGGGGGAGVNNDGTGIPGAGNASSGAAGGGIVMVRAGEIAGTGTVNANGADANNTLENDGSGGGGAGGSVLLSALRAVSGTAVSVLARGGNGGSNTGGGQAHGPGGGGGGGFVASSNVINVTSDVSGGVAGTTVNGGIFGPNYGATAGDGGPGISVVTPGSIPGLSSGGECTPTVSKSFEPPITTPGGPTELRITVVNNNPTEQLTAIALTDTYPADLVNYSAPAPRAVILPGQNACPVGAALTATGGGNIFSVTSGVIDPGATCTYAVKTTALSATDKTNVLASGAVSGKYVSGAYTVATATLNSASATLTVAPPLAVIKSSEPYSDPVNGKTQPKMIPGGYVAYTITVTNPSALSVDADSVAVIDATPAGLSLRVERDGNQGPVTFVDGSPSSGLSYTYSGLNSTTDDVDFSNDGGLTWTYAPISVDGVDPNVTHVRIRPKSGMLGNGKFSLLMDYLIR